MAVGLGAIGVALPVLPTTPFIILAAICFSGSSPRMYIWLSESRYFGEFITNYREGSGVSRRTKVISLFFLWTLLLVSMYFSGIIVAMILAIVGVCVTAHILLLKGRIETSIPTSDDG